MPTRPAHVFPEGLGGRLTTTTTTTVCDDCNTHLPDAAVVHATRMLRRASPEPAGALDSLTRGSRMGGPIFAPVAKLFLDGLTALIFDPDFESGALDERLYHAVRIVMMRVVPGQALTIVPLENRKLATGSGGLAC